MLDASFPHFFWPNRNTITDQPTQKAPLTIQNFGETSEPPIYRCKKKHTQPVSFPLHSHSFPNQCWLYLFFSSLKHVEPHFWGVGSTLKHSSFSKKKHGQFHSIHTVEPVIVLSHGYFPLNFSMLFPSVFSHKIHKDLDLGRTECRCVCVCTVISRVICGCFSAAASSTRARPPQKAAGAPWWRCDDANVMGNNLGIG